MKQASREPVEARELDAAAKRHARELVDAQTAACRCGVCGGGRRGGRGRGRGGRRGGRERGRRPGGRRAWRRRRRRRGRGHHLEPSLVELLGEKAHGGANALLCLCQRSAVEGHAFGCCELLHDRGDEDLRGSRWCGRRRRWRGRRWRFWGRRRRRC
jgi:hypothetical protein